jgi:hypothetical protein
MLRMRVCAVSVSAAGGRLAGATRLQANRGVGTLTAHRKGPAGSAIPPYI